MTASESSKSFGSDKPGIFAFIVSLAVLIFTILNGHQSVENRTMCDCGQNKSVTAHPQTPALKQRTQLRRSPLPPPLLRFFLPASTPAVPSLPLPRGLPLGPATPSPPAPPPAPLVLTRSLPLRGCAFDSSPGLVGCGVKSSFQSTNFASSSGVKPATMFRKCRRVCDGDCCQVQRSELLWIVISGANIYVSMDVRGELERRVEKYLIPCERVPRDLLITL